MFTLSRNFSAGHSEMLVHVRDAKLSDISSENEYTLRSCSTFLHVSDVEDTKE